MQTPMSEQKRTRGGARPGAGRPRKAEAEKAKQPPQISFRLSREERALAEAIAIANGMSLPEFAKHVLREILARARPAPPA